MPPAGSRLTSPGYQTPQDSNPSASHSSYLSALRQIDSIPVHDLASTLTTPAEDDTGIPSLSYLRTQIGLDPQDEWRAQNAEREISEEEHRLRLHAMSAAADLLNHDDQARRERLQRVLSRLNRLHRSASGADGADRAPSSEYTASSAFLYDHSPAGESEGEGNGEDEEVELTSIIRELRRQLPGHHPEVLRVMAEAVQADMNRERSQTEHVSRFIHSQSNRRNESSLRSAAILQAVRSHPRFTARSREYMQRYVVDRAERTEAGAGADIPATTTSTTTARERYSPTNDRYPWNGRSAWESVPASSAAGPRMRRALPQDSTMRFSNAASDRLKQTIIYLSNLRRSSSYEDSLGYAVDAQFVTKEFFGDRHDDFVLDVHSLAPTTATTILSRGAKFKGYQKANPDLVPINERTRRMWERTLGRESSSDSSRRDYLPRLTLDDPTRPLSSQLSSSIPPHAQRAGQKYLAPDQWPVEVTIHEVDWQRMTLSATMEAQDVPSHSPFSLDPRLNNNQSSRPMSYTSTSNPLHTDGPLDTEILPDAAPVLPPIDPSKFDTLPRKTITTYLEGEILDLRTHSFYTESFPSTASNDATYWRKLEPFRDLTDDQLHRKLVSREFLNDLSEKYILMRWKERCFVDDSHRATSSSNTTNRNSESYEVAEGCGLTISGFYYVCLRRRDGRIEGLYCDPQSSPYQHLILQREQSESWWWAYEFK